MGLKFLFMLCAPSSELALRAVLYLAQQPSGKLCPVHEIARGARLRQAYLAKILQCLTRARLVRAFRGPGGGMELARPAKDITLADVIEAMKGPHQDWCVLEPHPCTPDKPCPLHSRWAPVRLQLQALMNDTTLASLVKRRSHV